MQKQHAEPVAEVAGRLSLVLSRYNRRLRTEREGLSPGLLSALATVAKRGPIRLADLARAELVSAPTITRAVADLEQMALVTRSVDPEDGRAALVAVTSAGLAAVDAACATRARVASELLLALDEGDIRSIRVAMPALERMIGQL